MGNYTGAKCLVCGETFKKDDDVVVCPECGTPYHRECYRKEGKCINTEFHEKGISWTDSTDENGDDGQDNKLRCIRCGAENDADKLFCEQCGTPLIKNDTTERPFNETSGKSDGINSFGANPNFSQNNPNNANGMPYGPFGQRMVFDKNSDIDGVKLEDYANYVRTNPLSMLSNFIRFGKFGGKVSLNIGAFLFPEIYFLFRKMKGIGIALLAICAALSVPNMIELLATGYGTLKVGFPFDVTGVTFTVISTASWYIMMLIKVLAGLFANYIYYKQAKRDIAEIRAEETDESVIKQKISAKGGTSWPATFLGYAIYLVVTVGVIFGINQLM